MDNSLKTKEKPPKRGATRPSRKGKTKTFLIGKELKTKDLRHTAAERASGPGNKPKPNGPDSLRREASQAAGAAPTLRYGPAGDSAPLLGGLVLVRNDGTRPLGEEFLLFGRKPDVSADPTADIPGCDLGDAHLLTPKCDGNGAGNLNRLLALPDGYRWRGRRNERAVCLFNDGARLPGELFLAGARKPDISADPVLPLSSEVSGDEHLLTTNHQRDTAAGDPNRPVARSDGYFRFHLSGSRSD